MTALQDIAAERRRQVSVEGWTPEHDDQHGDGAMALAAAGYAVHSAKFRDAGALGAKYATKATPPIWPWSREWWKPSTPRRDLVKAGALIVAEIERLDRKATDRREKEILESRFGADGLDIGR